MLNKVTLAFVLGSALLTGPALAQEKKNCVSQPHWGFPAHKIARPQPTPCVPAQTGPTEQVDLVQSEAISVVQRALDFFLPSSIAGMPHHKVARLQSSLAQIRKLESGQAYSGLPAHKQAMR
ncbi:MAG: hypothetical protein AB7I41_20495 [Candidatus Sericytochromatia bacterium]